MNSSDLFSLEGKVAVITGGYGVLGGSIATSLVGAGARIAILGRQHDRAEQKVDELRKAGADARALIADVLQSAPVVSETTDSGVGTSRIVSSSRPCARTSRSSFTTRSVWWPG